ncbi:MAG: amidohydrolase family protein, partial [Gordonia polyisoprenivorans]|nr:amidohydrolase family protein [Gordonia polyisoprenivorans]
RAGSLSVGKDADLVVLDEDIRTAVDIGALTATMTMVGGTVVHAI